MTSNTHTLLIELEDKMQKIRFTIIALWMLLCSVNSAAAQVSIGIGLPNVSIGINLPLFPELARVPGYPVYYAPRVDANYFFYDGMYWVYQDDDWYASSWYNGPWWLVEPEVVPLFILRVPVRYYRQPPVYFRGWRSNAPPRWGEHWGHEWEQHRRGWDRWNRSSAPKAAPLPVYQRQYSGDRYPRQLEQQHKLRSQKYRYQPRDKMVRQHFQQQIEHKTPPPVQRGRQEQPATRSQQQHETQRSVPIHQGGTPAPRPQPPHRGGEDVQKSAPDRTPVPQRGPAVQDQKQQPGAGKREHQAPSSQGHGQGSQDRGEAKEPHQGQGRGQDKGEDRGRERDN